MRDCSIGKKTDSYIGRNSYDLQIGHEPVQEHLGVKNRLKEVVLSDVEQETDDCKLRRIMSQQELHDTVSKQDDIGINIKSLDFSKLEKLKHKLCQISLAD